MATDEQHDDNQQDHGGGNDPDTFTQRGVGVTDVRSGPKASSPVPGSGGRSAIASPSHGCLDLRRRQFTRHDVDVNADCIVIDVTYTDPVPKLWNETIEAHRAAVRDATLDTTAALVAEHGLRSVTMSQIAEQTGIGRATLYKYFPDVEAILLAWHERQVTGHLKQLADVRDQAGDAGERLEAVLEAYALISYESHGHHDSELAAFLHRDEQVARAQRQLRDMVRDLLAEAAATGAVRNDVAPDELASYCLRPGGSRQPAVQGRRPAACHDHADGVAPSR